MLVVGHSTGTNLGASLKKYPQLGSSAMTREDVLSLVQARAVP
jgi:hypothetical protein